MQPLDAFERSEWIARELESLGAHRAAAHERSRQQAQRMMNRGPQNRVDHYFQIDDWVKMKNHQATKFAFSWKGPYTVVSLGPPGTYRLRNSRGDLLPSLVNQSELAPWLTPLADNENFFYDRTVTEEMGGGVTVSLIQDSPARY